MLHALLNWFYCLPFTQALFFLVIFSLFFLLFRQRLGKKGFWRPGVALFALFWLLFIVSATLFNRGISESRTAPALIPFFSYYSVLSGGNKEILRSNFMNVALFFPAGLLVSELLPQGWRRRKKLLFVSLLFALLSAGIECGQFCFALGHAETDDVIHNTLGALTGALICCVKGKSANAGKDTAG